MPLGQGMILATFPRRLHAMAMMIWGVGGVLGPVLAPIEKLRKSNKNILELEIKDFSKLKFKDYFYNYKKYMNLIEYSELRKLIFD